MKFSVKLNQNLKHKEAKDTFSFLIINVFFSAAKTSYQIIIQIPVLITLKIKKLYNDFKKIRNLSLYSLDELNKAINNMRQI